MSVISDIGDLKQVLSKRRTENVRSTEAVANNEIHGLGSNGHRSNYVLPWPQPASLQNLLLYHCNFSYSKRQCFMQFTDIPIHGSIFHVTEPIPILFHQARHMEDQLHKNELRFVRTTFSRSSDSSQHVTNDWYLTSF